MEDGEPVEARLSAGRSWGLGSISPALVVLGILSFMNLSFGPGQVVALSGLLGVTARTIGFALIVGGGYLAWKYKAHRLAGLGRGLVVVVGLMWLFLMMLAVEQFLRG